MRQAQEPLLKRDSGPVLSGIRILFELTSALSGSYLQMSAIIHQGYVPAPALPHRKWVKSSYFFLDPLQLQEAIRHASW